MEKETKTLFNINYIEKINEIDNLIFEFLYSQNGFTKLEGKIAIEKINEYIQKFNFKFEKILKNIPQDFQENFKNKKEEFYQLLKLHYKQELIKYAQDVYENFIKNSIIQVWIYKNNSKKLNEIFNNGLKIISWFCEIKKENKANLIENFKKEFNKALISNEKDLIEVQTIKTDENFFLEIRNKILNKTQEFLELNLDEFYQKLNKKDLYFFKKIQQKLKTSFSNSIKDEIILLNSCLEILNLKTNFDKYNFLISAQNDFEVYYSLNKKINEDDKINLLKRRMKIFEKDNKEPSKNQNAKKYFTKLLTALNG